MSKEHQAYDLQANIQKVLTVMQSGGDGGEDTNTSTDEEERETIHVYPVEGGGILLTRTPIEEDEDLDTTPPTVQQPTANDETGVVFFGLFVILICLLCILVQLSLIMNPFTVTITLAAKAQQLAVTGTLQLGRVLSPLTLSQSHTIPTTGRGHQDAKQATGYVTFYNGQFNQVTIPAGTLLTGNDGIQIATDQDSTLPGVDTSANPPILGQATVAAQATSTGSRGNIAAYDINQACCAPSVFAKNTTPFHGGQNERTFQTVAKSDIANTAAPLKAALNQGVQGVLQGQLKPNEDLVTPSCTTTTTADHQPGEEATTVKVAVSETCSAVAYDQDALQAKVTDLLNRQAEKKLGAGYSLLGYPTITITQASSQNSKAVLSFSSQSTWVYALSSKEQKHLKNMLAGKTKEQAMQLLAALPGIESIAMHSSGFGDDTNLPKDLAHIRILVIYAAAGLFASRRS
jgi:Baseplate J-like protein